MQATNSASKRTPKDSHDLHHDAEQSLRSNLIVQSEDSRCCQRQTRGKTREGDSSNALFGDDVVLMAEPHAGLSTTMNRLV